MKVRCFNSSKKTSSRVYISRVVYNNSNSRTYNPGVVVIVWDQIIFPTNHERYIDGRKSMNEAEAISIAESATYESAGSPPVPLTRKHRRKIVTFAKVMTLVGGQRREAGENVGCSLPVLDGWSRVSGDIKPRLAGHKTGRETPMRIASLPQSHNPFPQLSISFYRSPFAIARGRNRSARDTLTKKYSSVVWENVDVIYITAVSWATVHK